jgi:hypothetical protein
VAEAFVAVEVAAEVAISLTVVAAAVVGFLAYLSPLF